MATHNCYFSENHQHEVILPDKSFYLYYVHYIKKKWYLNHIFGIIAKIQF